MTYPYSTYEYVLLFLLGQLVSAHLTHAWLTSSIQLVVLGPIFRSRANVPIDTLEDLRGAAPLILGPFSAYLACAPCAGTLISAVVVAPSMVLVADLPWWWLLVSLAWGRGNTWAATRS